MKEQYIEIEDRQTERWALTQDVLKLNRGGGFGGLVEAEGC